MISDSHKVKFIFLGINKTGTTSIRSVLKKYGGKGKHTHFYNGSCNNGLLLSHKNKSRCKYDNQHIIYPDKINLDSYYKFAIVRNPWDRLISLYKWGKQIKKTNKNYHTYSFKDFIMTLHTAESPFPELRQVYLPTKPMLDWVRDKDGCIITDFIGRFENIERDWAVITEKLGISDRLPHLYTTKREHYGRYYDDEMARKVADLYEEDIRYFNYKF